MNLSPYIVALLGFGFTYGLIRFLAPRAERLGLIDQPGGRKQHAHKTPTVGGVAILTGLALTALCTGFLDRMHLAFWVSVFLIALAGALDDRFDLGPYIKFAAQIAAALLMIYWGGLSLHSLGKLVSHEPVLLGSIAVPLTVIAVIGVVNAINFCDGADGLAGGLVVIAVFWIAVMSAATQYAGTLAMAFALLGCMVAFMVFNMRSPMRSRAMIFLGDAGSLSLGFVLAWLTVGATQGTAKAFAPVTAIWLLAIPVSDTIVCMGRRLAKGQSPFRGDRMHLHHILIDLGMPVSRAVALIQFVAFALGGAGVAGWVLGVPDRVMFYAAMAVFALYVFLVQYGLKRIAERAPGSGRAGTGAIPQGAWKHQAGVVEFATAPSADYRRQKSTAQSRPARRSGTRKIKAVKRRKKAGSNAKAPIIMRVPAGDAEARESKSSLSLSERTSEDL